MDFLDRYNAMVGALIGALTIVLGPQWYLFGGYLVLNVLDWLTGWYRSRKMHEESSEVGLKGIVKKTLYWVLIVIAFLFPDMFIRWGNDVMGVNFSFLMFVGWLTLGMLIINEMRSIIENLVQCGVEVPDVITSGLAVTQKLLDAKKESEIPKNDK